METEITGGIGSVQTAQSLNVAAGSAALPDNGRKTRLKTALRRKPDPLSDKMTILLIRRTLCDDSASIVSAPVAPSSLNPSSPSSAESTADFLQHLPPLTSRNDVDLQLYALLAIIVREFILPWYSRITSNAEFATEIVRMVAHCTRGLEQRLRQVDLEALVFDELPALLDSHVQAYRMAHAPLVALPIETNPRAIYHAILPLPALSPVPSNDSDDTDDPELEANEAAYRQLLVRGLLTLLLPPEDLDNACLTDLLTQIFAELLIGSVLARRLAEPWMMWEVLGMLARLVRQKLDGEVSEEKQEKLEKLEKQEQKKEPEKDSPILSLFWSAVRIGLALFSLLRFLVSSISLARSLPSRLSKTSSSSSSSYSSPTPVLAYSLWPALASLAELDARMPWLYGCLSLLQWLALTGPGRIGAFDGPLDRLLSHYLCKHALDPALLPTLLRSVRAAVFPGNKFGATPPTLVPPTTAEEEAALRRRTAEAVWMLQKRETRETRPGSSSVSKVPTVSGPSDAALAEIEDSLLDLFSDAYCNKHLLYSILEAIFVRLMPEMAETDDLGLWEEQSK